MATAPQLKVAPDPSVETAKPTLTAYEELANYRTLVARVVDAFGDEQKASVWLSTPNASLNGEIPLRVAQKAGYESFSLEPILTRIEHGIYS
jgi:uncharacterized protein (DUF2384 family)